MSAPRQRGLSRDLMRRLTAAVSSRPGPWPEVMELIGMVSFCVQAATPEQVKRLSLAATDVGLVAMRRNRETGTEVLIYDNDLAGIDAGEPTLHYFVVCGDHGYCVGVETLAVAKSEAAGPTRWCEGCRT